MGLFDILTYDIKCPTCKKNREWEIQIKTFNKDCRMATDYPTHFKIGDEVITHNDIISGVGICPICGKRKYININILNGVISSKYNLIGDEQ